MDEILKFIGQMVFVGGGAAAITLGLFIFLGKSWVDRKFAQALEKYKGQQNTELEKLKLKINTLFNKVVKIHDREYEILPGLWQKLVILELEVARAVNMFKQMPDLDKFSPEVLDDFLEVEKVPKIVAEQIRRSRNKITEYDSYCDRKQMNVALGAFHNYKQYFDENKIFLREDIKKRFAEIDQKMWGVWASRQTSLRAPNAGTDFWIKAHEQLIQEVKPLMNEIESLVQQHLYGNEQL